jgi:hypothetical protein
MFQLGHDGQPQPSEAVADFPLGADRRVNRRVSRERPASRCRTLQRTRTDRPRIERRSSSSRYTTTHRLRETRVVRCLRVCHRCNGLRPWRPKLRRWNDPCSTAHLRRRHQRYRSRPQRSGAQAPRLRLRWPIHSPRCRLAVAPWINVPSKSTATTAHFREVPMYVPRI